MSDQLVLNAEPGRAEGSRASRRLRREGRVPAVVYGLEADPVAISVEWTDLRAALTTDAGLNALIQLTIGGEEQLSIIKDLQRHPVRRDVIHVDFLRVTADQEIEVDIRIELLGEALEVGRADGIVAQLVHELQVLCKPGDVPDVLEFDISALEIGSTVRVADLPLPAGVRTEVDGEEIIAIAEITRSTIEAMAADDAAEAAEAEEGFEGGSDDAADTDTDGGDADGDAD